MKKFLTTLSLAAMMAIPAVAQEATDPKTTTMTPAESREIVTEKVVVHTGIVSANELINKSVKNASNETVGDINDLQINSDGKIAAVILGVGGILGVGEKNVALPYEKFAFNRDTDGSLVVKADVTKEALKSAPEWKKSDSSS